MILEKFDIFEVLLLLIGIYTLITYVWQKIELKYNGKIQHDKMHTLYAIALSLLWTLVLTSVSYLIWLGMLGVIAVRIWIMIILIKILLEHRKLQELNKELTHENEQLLENLKRSNDNVTNAINIADKANKRYEELLKSLNKN